MTPEQEAIVRRFLAYAFKDIAFEYRGLTKEERSFCTKEEWADLMVWLRRA